MGFKWFALIGIFLIFPIATATVKYYNFTDTSNNKCYWLHETTDPVITNWANGWATTSECTYTNLVSNNGLYFRITPGSTNDDDWIRFNFTITESVTDINSIRYQINGAWLWDSGETSYCWLARFENNTWIQGCTTTQTDGDCNVTLSNDFSAYISPTNQIVMKCQGFNVDTADYLDTDFVELTIDSSTSTTTTTVPVTTSTTTMPPWYFKNETSIDAISYFNISWADDNSISKVLIETNVSGVQNYTMDNDFGGNIYNYTVPLTVEAAYYWKSYANDSGNNFNSTPAWSFTFTTTTTTTTTTTSTTTTPPFWSLNETSIGDISYFNITWVDIDGVDIALIETNVSGVNNYTMGTDFGGNIYNYTVPLTVEAAYYWKSYANDSGNNFNSTPAWIFTYTTTSTTTTTTTTPGETTTTTMPTTTTPLTGGNWTFNPFTGNMDWFKLRLFDGFF